MLHRLLQALVILGAALAATPGRAADAVPLSSSEADLVHFAFASQLGSGIYSVDGRTLQIYRLPFSWRIAEPKDGRPGLRLRLPATIGLFDFEAGDLVEEGIPDQLDTLSIGLGVELDFPVGERWHIVPYGEAGRAWRVGDGDDYATYSASLHARAEYPMTSARWRLQAGLLWAGIEDLYGRRGDFARVEAGAESRWTLGFDIAGETADAGVYLVAEWYIDPPEEPVITRSLTSDASAQQFEVGVTLGTEPPARLWRIPLPRIGVAWRFGSDLSVFRIVFGSAF
ncbi:MAG: hypothetical protein MUC71_11575 [Steroidobacteraceae bacterium]|jgi:hypothetical protein|nr:hypothetical protein [Steroidobacteraceae bacterium]